ncbi:TPA: IS5 family transposase [Neisseria weaveri]
MSSFLHTDALHHIEKHLDRFPLIKLDRILDRTPIEQYLAGRKTRYVRDNGGRPAYPLLSMFKAVLLGQWHSLSDPELEHSLITRIDFHLFCRFDELSIPDHSTLCRYRNRPAQNNTLAELLDLINRQLTDKGLKVEKASAAIVDATIIQTAGGKQRQAIEVDDEGRVNSQTTPSKDSDARWVKKDGRFHPGYKQHTRTDADGYIEKLHITPANAHECKHLLPLLEDLAQDTTVYADKGYDSRENRQHLIERQLRDGIMQKAHRGCPLSQEQKIRNGRPAKVRYVVEQSFGTLHRKFRYGRAAYFGLGKVRAQSHLKAMCVNLLKAANRIGVPVAA